MTYSEHSCRLFRYPVKSIRTGMDQHFQAAFNVAVHHTGLESDTPR